MGVSRYFLGGKMILLRQVSRYVYDIFAGTGWPMADAVLGASNASWSRVRKHHWTVSHINGEPINRAQAKQLLALIEAYPNGAIDPLSC
jgi:hypothetical protein